jgi:hypothetical protein
MNKPVVFTTPSGDRMAVVPLDQYKRLVEAAEDADDVTAYDRAKARLASGHDELVPSEIVRRIVAGEGGLKVWREYRGLSAREVAERAKISASFLTQLESGQRKRGIGTRSGPARSRAGISPCRSASRAAHTANAVLR